MRALFPIALLLALLASAVPGETAEEFAQRFLDAWVFHDHGQMYELLTPGRQASLTQAGLAERAQALPLLADGAEIVSATPEGESVQIRYRIRGTHPSSGQPTSIAGTLNAVPTGDGGWRADFQVPSVGAGTALPSVGQMTDQLANTARSYLPNALPPTQVIDGMTIAQLMDDATRAHGEVQAMRTDMAMTGRLMGQGHSMRGTFLFQAPNRLRLDLDDAVFVSDGLTATVYLRAANAHFRLPASMLETDLSGIAPGFGAMGSQVQASLLGRETVQGRPAWHVAVSPQGAGQMGVTDMVGMMGNMNVWLDTETLLPRRVQMGGMGSSIQIDFGEVEIDPADVGPEDFAFTPPAGSMELPMMLPGLGGFSG